MIDLVALIAVAHAATVALPALVVAPDVAPIVAGAPAAAQPGLQQALEAAGLAGTESDADFVLAGRVVELQHRDSAPWTVEVSIDWALEGRATKSVAYKVTTRGVAYGKSDADPDAIRSAVAESFDHLLSRSKLKAAIEAGPPRSGLAPAEWSAPVHVRSCARADANLPKDMSRVLPAVVVVRVSDAVGTGALISPDGFVLTAAHVVREGETPSIRTSSGVELPATVVRVDEAQDVALLHVTGSGYTCLPVDADAAEPGSDLFAVGSPAGLDFSVSKGIVSGLRTLDGWSFLQTDAAINPGNSGGPMLDARGRLLAVVSWKVSAEGFEGLGFGVPGAALLTRLGIEYGSTSDTELASLAGRVGKAGRSAMTVVDAADPRRFGAVSPAEMHARDQRKRRASGIVLAGLGAVAVGGTWYWATTTDHAPDVPWTVASVANAAGWASIAGGGLLVGLSVVPTHTDAPGVVVVGGRF